MPRYLYVGNHAEIDSFEGEDVPVLGPYGNPTGGFVYERDTDPTDDESAVGTSVDEGDGLAFVDVTLTDANTDDLISSDVDKIGSGDPGTSPGDQANTGDTFDYDIGLGTVNGIVDTVFFGSATLTLSDGSTQVIEAIYVQMTNGDLFIRPGEEGIPGISNTNQDVNVTTDDDIAAASLDIVSVEFTSFTDLGIYNDNSPISEHFENADPQDWAAGIDVVCFTTGTLIHTDQGELPIEKLTVGDLIYTEDSGFQPLRWIGNTKISQKMLESNPKLLPICISKNSLGENMPYQDLVVSRQHRVLVRSAIAERMFGAPEVLIPAVKLLDVDGIEVMNDIRCVQYWHLLFDSHKIVVSNGAATESLFTGPEALKALSSEAREEVLSIFPQLMLPSYTASPVYYIPSIGRKMKKLVQRHRENGQKFYENPVGERLLPW